MKKGVLNFFISPVALLACQLLNAAPQQPDIQSGSVQISSQAKQTVIQQNTERAIINWKSFSVGVDEHLIFQQPGAGSATLNRVMGHQVSAILGRLDANGKVLLINPNGIVFGKDSKVNVGSLIASTTDISNQNFLKGRLLFDQPSSVHAKIINQGQITAAESGLVALVAPQVSNSGVISARLGKVVLAAGEKFTIDLYGDELISFAVDQRELRALVDHSGVINTEAGQVVLMTARDGSAVLDNMINMSGVIRADTATWHNDGSITLTAGAGSANVSGYMSASALKQGDGGKVIVWSDDHTEFTGQIDAHAGRQSGDGGFVEVSGKKTLDFSGMVDAGADAGNAGTLLLDPEYVTIGSQEAATLAMILTNGTNATVDATIDISVLAMIDGRGGAAGGALTLNAGNTINLYNYIVTNNGDISLNASSGSINLYSGFGVYAGSGAVTLNAGSGMTIDSLINAGSLNLATGGNLNIRQYLVSNTGSLTANAGGSIAIASGYGIYAAGNSLSLQAGANLTSNSMIEAAGSASINLTAATNLTLNHHVLSANRPINLAATAGTVAVAGGYGVFSGSAALSVVTGGNLTNYPFMTTGNLSLQSTGGSLNINTGITDSIGNLTLNAATDVNINASIVSMSTGSSVSATAGNDINVNAQVDGSGGVAGGTLTMNAGGNINISEHLVTNNAAVNLTAGGTVIQLADGNDADGNPQTKQIRTGNATITVNAGGDYSPGSMITTGSLDLHTNGNMTIASAPIYETVGYVELSSAGSFTTSLPLANTTTGANLLINAGGDINVNDELGPWDGTTGALRAAAVQGGTITLVSGGNINVNEDIVTYNGALSLFAGTTAAKAANCSTPPCTINLTDGNKVDAGNATLSVTSYSNLLVDGNVPNTFDATPVSVLITTGALNIESTIGDVTFEEIIPDTTGELTVRAGNDIIINNKIYTADANASFYAGNDFTLTAAGARIDISAGNLWIEAVNDIQTSDIRNNGNLTVKSTAGHILSGTVQQSDPDGGYPSSIHLAGYLGISNFSTGQGSNIDALSAAGSVTSLGFYYPGSLRIIAHDNITLSSTQMSNPMLYAGNDITLGGIIGNSILAKAGGDFFVNDTGDVAIADNLDISAGTDPFATLTGVTVAGVAVPSWSVPGSGGDVTFGTDNVNDIVWIEETAAGENAFVTINATNDIVLPRVHVSWSLTSAANTQDVKQSQTTFTLNAGNEITLQQIETMGDVTIQTTNNDINLGSTIGAHVTVETPDIGMWNPTDVGVANLTMQSTNADINMHEARAVGDINITAPNGQVNFIAPGGLKGIEAGGTVSVTDSDGVIYDNAITLTTVGRIPEPGVSAPSVPPGPTIAGAAAPAVPGALPPGAPGGVSVGGTASPGSSAGSLPGASGVPSSSPVTEIVVNEVTVNELELGEIEVAALDVEGLEQTGSLSEEQTTDSDEVTELLPGESLLDSFMSSAEEGLFLVSSQQDIQINPLVFDTLDGTFVVFDSDDEEDRDLGR